MVGFTTAGSPFAYRSDPSATSSGVHGLDAHVEAVGPEGPCDELIPLAAEHTAYYRQSPSSS